MFRLRVRGGFDVTVGGGVSVLTVEIEEVEHTPFGYIDYGRSIKLRFVGRGISKGAKAGLSLYSDWTDTFLTPKSVTLEEFAGSGYVMALPSVTIGDLTLGFDLRLFFHGANVTVKTSPRGLSLTVFSHAPGSWSVV